MPPIAVGRVENQNEILDYSNGTYLYRFIYTLHTPPEDCENHNLEVGSLNRESQNCAFFFALMIFGRNMQKNA